MLCQSVNDLDPIRAKRLYLWVKIRDLNNIKTILPVKLYIVGLVETSKGTNIKDFVFLKQKTFLYHIENLLISH